MKKITTLLAFLLFAVTQGAFAQKTITGKVISSEDDLGMPGVPVVVKGTTVGTATDIDGNFTLSVPNDAATLVVSYMGYRTVELPVGNQTRFNITLDPDAIALGDVVVTALGIQRETKTLTYSAQQVSGAEMMKAQDINFMNALSGKAAGLEIKKAASGPGGATRTVLRGSRSFTGVGSPLFVIDGVPITNRLGGQSSMWAGVNEGDGLSALNPEDVESISVLKGANAAILYGSEGANGVILITTKKGTEGTVDVNIGSASTFENVIFIPELQYKYGAIGNQTKESWDNLPHNNTNGYTEKDVMDFFQTGYNLVNNITISGGNSRTTAFFNYTNTMARGIIPSNDYSKHNISLRQSTKFLQDKITVGTNLMLTDEMSYNRMANGWEENPLTGLYWFPRQHDIRNYNGGNYKYIDENRYLDWQNWFLSIHDHHQINPWWIINKQPRWDGGQRLIGNATVSWDIAKKLRLTIKGSYDFASKRNEQRWMAGSNTVRRSLNGAWYYRRYEDKLFYVDGILTYNNNFGDFSLTAIAGASTQRYRYGDGVRVNNDVSQPLIYPNEFQFQNLNQLTMVQTTLDSKGIKRGVFGNATIGFKEMLFLDLSGRNDWASSLALTESGVSYFYPAIGLSGIVSQMVSLPEFVTFGKIRGSYTTIANDLGFDNVVPGAGIDDATLGVGSPDRPEWYDAKPEMNTSIEIGTDWRFLEGRVGFDVTWYHITSTDQRITVPILQGTGYRNKYMNAGKIVNHGIELMIDAEPIVTSDFSWRTAVNFAYNKNEIVEVNPNDPTQRIGLGNSEGYYRWIQVGGSYGDLYAYNFVYDDHGRMKLNDNRVPLKSADPEYVGSSNPDFTLGWNNTFGYKRWSMSFLINGVFGGTVMSMTEAMNDAYGVSQRTADARDIGYLEINGVDPTGNAVTQVNPRDYYLAVGNRNGIFANYAYDRTNIRLTQFSLTYDVPVRVLNLPIKSASVGLTGQNLFFLYNKAPYDPEIAMSAGTGVQALDNFNLPATRTYGFNIRVNF